MLIDITVIVAAVAGVLLCVGFLWLRNRSASSRELTDAKARYTAALAEAESVRRQAELEAQEELFRARAVEAEGRSMREAALRAEDRVRERESRLAAEEASLARRRDAVDGLERHARDEAARAETLRVEQAAALERVSGMTAADARKAVLARAEEEAQAEAANIVRRIEGEARQEAERRAREVVVTAIQRTAAAHASESTVSVLSLASDDLKGRIIGREGRNIRALEHLTGVDVIIDETPQAVVLSSFDSVRREIARATLEKLLADGRIHPSRIEEAYYEAKAQVEEMIVKAGEEACYEAKVHALHPEIVAVLGRLRFRTSYSQNVLKHVLECSHLAATMAAELGANERVARRAALLHDLGKALDQEMEGSHALVGARYCRDRGESEEVCHAIAAHHNEVEPHSVEAMLVQAADAISAARPGARGEQLESYLTRLRALEEIATSKPGVERCFAVQAGREVRVIVRPVEVSDAEAERLSAEIARDIEREVEYPGSIKVTVIRESRATHFAR
ncbi:MAG: ribonucrease [Miltoncostaeaceae bacterium]|jgi:ribonuclease Y|nr:ribonucrease [Miltoncostaeaceae bacterium]